MDVTVSTYILELPGGGAATVRIDRQSLPDGRVCNTLIADTGEILGCWWEKAPKKQRRGSKSRYCFGPDWDELTAAQRDALSSIRTMVMNDGRIRSRRKYRQGRQMELAATLGAPGLLDGLIKAGAIYEKDGWFYVDRRFLFRG